MFMYIKIEYNTLIRSQEIAFISGNTVWVLHMFYLSLNPNILLPRCKEHSANSLNDVSSDTYSGNCWAGI